LNTREERLLRTLVRGHLPTATDFDRRRLQSVARYHRVAPLVLDRWADRPPTGVEAVVDALRVVAAADAARDMHQVAALRDTLAACEQLGLRVLVLKGSALGPLLYGRSELRPRLDVDVWLQGWDAVEAVEAVLETRGFRPAHQLPGRVARHALSMGRPTGSAAIAVDLHARSSRRLRVAEMIEFDDTWRASIPVRIEGIEARTLAPADALLHSALHLTSHHAGATPPWIHLEDLARLALQVDADQWESLLDRLGRHELASAFQTAARQVDAWAAGAFPGWVLARLEAATPDASARFRHELRALADDLSRLSATQAASYVAELVFPPADYLRHHFGTARNRSPVLLWSWRLVDGVARRLRR
jgi:hypothetical protein